MYLVILTTAMSFIIMFLIGPMFIPFLKKLKFGQNIREEGPQSHLVKAGTPTMGGLMIILAVTVTCFVFIKDNFEIIIALSVTLGFGLIGFIDDYIKVILKRNLGLRAYQKIVLQLLIAILLVVYSGKHPNIGTILNVPFFDLYIDLKMLYYPFTVVFIVGFVNAVNLTDGLDGLASGVSFFSSVFFAISCAFNGYYELSIFAGSVVGASLGFLRFNIYPAKVFMGDTGSMALGGALAALAVLTRMQLFFFIVGGIFLIEAISVIIQVGYFKLSGGRRVFKMAPIHHHFELSGWHEKKVVKNFWIAAFVFSMLGYFGLIIR